jgi:hypothetical protein
MLISFSCEFCGKQYHLDDMLAGKRVRCKECGHVFRIPAPAVLMVADVQEAEPWSEPTPPPASSVRAPAEARVPAQVPSYWAVAEDAEFAAPSRRFPKPPRVKSRRSSDGASLMSGVAAATFLIALLPLAGSLIGYAAGNRSAAGFCLVATMVIAGVNFIVAAVWQVVLPFQESTACGLMFIFVPFYGLYYTLSRWDAMKGPFFAAFGAILLVVGLSALAPQLNQGLRRNAPLVAAANPPVVAPPQFLPPGPDFGFGAPPAPPMLRRGFGPGFDPLERIRQHQEQFRQRRQEIDRLVRQGKQDLRAKYGDRALTITVTGLPPGDDKASASVSDQIKAALGQNVEWSATSENGVMVVVAGPIADPNAVAAKLTFGTVEQPSRGIINVVADATRVTPRR